MEKQERAGVKIPRQVKTREGEREWCIAMLHLKQHRKEKLERTVREVERQIEWLEEAIEERSGEEEK